MKIKFNSDDELPLNKTIKISVVVIVVRTVFHESNQYYASKEGDICHYWHFLNYSFKFQPNVCNRCHDLLMKSINLSNTTVLNIKGSDYGSIISLTSKNEAIILIQNADLTEKSGTL